VLAVLASLGAIRIWHLALAAFVNGIGWASDHPVRRMMIGDVVGADRIGSALSIDTATNNATRVLGPMLSGVLLSQFSIAGVFWFGAVLYALSVFAALRIRAPRHAGAGSASSFVTSLREGLAWARRDRPLLGVFAVTVIFNVFGWPFNSMIPVIATDYLHLQAEGVGLLASCDGVGGLIAALVAAGVVRPAWHGRIYVGAVALYLASVIGFVTATAVRVAALCLFLSGAFGSWYAILQVTLVYRAAPVALRARLLGVVSVCIGTAPLGFLYLGFLGDLFTPRIGTVALAAQGLLALLLTRRYWGAALRLS
jgi:predicted MFS family arabinose efflux permease